MSDAPPPLAPGDLLAGKYEIERMLGQGGMAIVFAARHVDLDERVAIKVLRTDLGGDVDDVVRRFLREAKAAAKIRSEHVARVSDVGRLDSGTPYMVMEYLEGCDLEELQQRHGRLEIEQTIVYVLQACEALAEAHALGIVHRDLKPANLFLSTRADGSPCVKVLDFGISKFTGPGSGTRTSSKGMLGSPIYMSPEQIRSVKDIDARTDVWSIGVILFELLAETPPFPAENLTKLVMKIVTDPPLSIQSIRDDVPPELEAVILRCLVKDRQERYQDVGALSAALWPFAPEGRLSAERIARVLARKPR